MGGVVGGVVGGWVGGTVGGVVGGVVGGTVLSELGELVSVLGCETGTDEVGTLIPEVSGTEEPGVAVGGATTQPTSKVITRSQLAITGNSFFLFIRFSLSKNFEIIIP